MQSGTTPIFSAALGGHKECIEVLARLGGDVNKADAVSVEGAAHVIVVVLGVDAVTHDCGRTWPRRRGPHRSTLQRRTATASASRCWQVWAAM